MKPIIRRACHEDATNIINAHRRSIRELCSKDYSSDQITAWAGFNFQEEHWHKTMDRDFVWVISDNQNIYSIHLTATKTAKAFYANLGFKQLGPQSTLKIGGKDIECFKMQQSLI